MYYRQDALATLQLHRPEAVNVGPWFMDGPLYVDLSLRTYIHHCLPYLGICMCINQMVTKL